MDEAGHSNLMCGAILGAACFRQSLPRMKNSMMRMQGRRGGSAPDDTDGGGGAVGRPGCTDVASCFDGILPADRGS